MEISVVSGTYNRIALLKNMVESVRNSLQNLHGFNYEIVLVDGGSTNGTQKWRKARFDFLHHSASPTDGGLGVIWK